MGFGLPRKNMAKKASAVFIHASNNFIRSVPTREKFRVAEADFTRNRKLPFEQLVLCMLKLLRKNIQSELYAFFRELGTKARTVTASAFVQGRKKLRPDLFYELNGHIVGEYYSDNDEGVALYKGLRVLSVDGSTVNLPTSPELVGHYGFYNNQKKTDDIVIGRVSVLYDVLNGIVVDGLLRPFSQGEISLAHEHLGHARKGDLLIMDRGYACFGLAWELREREVDFLFRCKVGHSVQAKAFYLSGRKDDTIEIRAKQKRSFKGVPFDQASTVTVRLIRVELGEGEAEVLMTSLLDRTEFPAEGFKELYFKRWGVETFYDRFKNIICVECFSGTSHQFIQQEFNCALYLSNMQTILTEEAEAEAREKYETRRYEYRVNRSMALGLIRERLVRIYSEPSETENLLGELKQLFVVNVVPVRPGRKYKRDVDKYRHRTKPKQFRNRKII